MKNEIREIEKKISVLTTLSEFKKLKENVEHLKREINHRFAKVISAPERDKSGKNAEALKEEIENLKNSMVLLSENLSKYEGLERKIKQLEKNIAGLKRELKKFIATKPIVIE